MSKFFHHEYTTVNSKYDKVEPRLHNYDYKNIKYAIYVYLDPFKQSNIEAKFQCCMKPQTVKFHYLPIYIGKLESPLAYRMNQHMHYFTKNIDDIDAKYKKQYLKDIEFHMKENQNQPNPDPMMPRNWDDYKKRWIIIIKRFDNKEDLREYERELIKAVGIMKDSSGPLTNVKKGN